jgi:membrane-associated phospholipid phosphatase
MLVNLLSAIWLSRSPALYRVARICHALSLQAAITFATLLLAYLAVSANGPLVDGVLLQADQALGFDWLGTVRFVEGHPMFAQVLCIAYLSFGPQIVLAPFVLGLCGDDRRMYIYFGAYLVSLVVICGVTVLASATGAFVHLGLDEADFPNLQPFLAFAFMDHFQALRAGSFNSFDPTDIRGMLTFPSFHACVGVLLIYAARVLPWLLFGPLTALNLCMIASALTNGGHYLVDVLVGVMLGLGSILACSALEWRSKMVLSTCPTVTNSTKEQLA